MSNAKIVSKLSLKALNAQPGKNSVKEGEAYDIAHLYGRTNKCETISTNYGDSTRFSGAFEGVNLKTQERAKSSRVFMPSVVEDLLAEAVAGLDEGALLDFAFVIGVEYSEKGSMGYAYTVRPLIELKESDELSVLRGVSDAELKALPAPKQDDATPAKTKGAKK